MKKTIRQDVLMKRDRINPDLREEKDSRIEENLFRNPEIDVSEILLLYASFRSEVNTNGIIQKMLEMRKRIVLPKVKKERHKLELYEIKNMSELKKGYMGIPEPSLTKDRLMDINDIDTIIIPGVGFDLYGNRLGYGGGYYDSLLSKITKRVPIIALAYEEQIVDSIPTDPHDRKVTIIITDKRIIRI